MKQKILDFLKKNIIYVIAIAVIIFLLLANAAKKRQIANQAAEYSHLETMFEGIQQDRDNLVIEKDSLEKAIKLIELQKDSITAVKAKLERRLRIMEADHKKEIDSLMKIPADTVYKRLQTIYPNYDGNDLRFPFSQSQIIPIYSTALTLPRIQQEYGLQTKILQTCNDLNKKYELAESNYKAQIKNLSTDIGLCNSQVGIRTEELKNTQKQLKRKSFWNYVFKGTTILFGTIAAIK